MSNNNSLATAGNGYDAAALAGRVLLSGMFILGGFAKLTAISGTAAWFGSIGLPLPTVTTVLVGLVELLGGLAVLVGFQSRIAAIVLAVFTVAATAIAHLELSDPTQMLLFQKNLAITGGFLLLFFAGAGRYSLDARRSQAPAYA
jgi:putative oxidoreductase